LSRKCSAAIFLREIADTYMNLSRNRTLRFESARNQNDQTRLKTRPERRHKTCD
jgi:hypothetical protein